MFTIPAAAFVSVVVNAVIVLPVTSDVITAVTV